MRNILHSPLHIYKYTSNGTGGDGRGGDWWYKCIIITSGINNKKRRDDLIGARGGRRKKANSLTPGIRWRQLQSFLIFEIGRKLVLEPYLYPYPTRACIYYAFAFMSTPWRCVPMPPLRDSASRWAAVSGIHLNKL